MTHPFDLTGQVAIVTGSSRGIGRSAAEIMAQMGAKVVVSSRKADACEEVAKGIRDRGGEAIVIPCNISRKGDVEALRLMSDRLTLPAIVRAQGFTEVWVRRLPAGTAEPTIVVEDEEDACEEVR